MTNKTQVSVGAPSISAMDLRRQPGTVLDSVYYRNESFIIERSGQPKAALIPIPQYNELQRIKKVAKSNLFKMIDNIQKRTSRYNPKEIQAAIDEATEKV